MFSFFTPTQKKDSPKLEDLHNFGNDIPELVDSEIW